MALSSQGLEPPTNPGRFTSLRTAIIGACTANGWALAGNVLHKGDLYLSIVVSGNFIDIQGGTGIDGVNALTGVAPLAARVGSLSDGTNYLAALTWPLRYEVFIGTVPDEVYVVLNYDTNKYQWLAWGKSTVLLPGTGMWFSGTFEGGRTETRQGIYLQLRQGSSSGYRTNNGLLTPALFFGDYPYDPMYRGEYVHHGLQGATWSSNSPEVSATKYRSPLEYATPSRWNSDAVLLPIQAYSRIYGNNKVALIVDCAHIRSCRIDNIDPGAVITLGTDRWKIFPWYRKDATNPLGGSGIAHTGCMGWAVRYDGP